MNNEMQLLTRVSAFVDMEADMLDHKEYTPWLDLWTDTGLYIVPVDHDSTDYKNSLNIAYDDSQMRKMRVARLQSGDAISTQVSGGTVRTPSRVRLIDNADEEDGVLCVRCAYVLFENNKNSVRTFPANVQFRLRPDGESFQIEEKVVRVMKSSEHITTISYLF